MSKGLLLSSSEVCWALHCCRVEPAFKISQSNHCGVCHSSLSIGVYLKWPAYLCVISFYAVIPIMASEKRIVVYWAELTEYLIENICGGQDMPVLRGVVIRSTFGRYRWLAKYARNTFHLPAELKAESQRWKGRTLRNETAKIQKEGRHVFVILVRITEAEAGGLALSAYTWARE